MLFGSTLSKGALTVIIIVGILAIAAIIAAVFYNKRKKEIEYYTKYGRNDLLPHLV